MNSVRRLSCLAVPAVAFGSLVFSVTSAHAQGGRGFFGGVSRLQLATLEQVQSELKLNDELKKQVTEINEKLGEQRGQLFREAGGAGDFAAIGEKMRELSTEADKKLAEALDDTQKKRMMGLYIQVNGASSLIDDEVGKAIGFDEEQKQKLQSANQENQEARRDAFADFQNMSGEEAGEALQELRKESDERLMAVLTDDQKEKLEALKGEAMDIDMSSLRGRGRFGGGRGRGGRPGGGTRPSGDN